MWFIERIGVLEQVVEYGDGPGAGHACESFGCGDSFVGRVGERFGSQFDQCDTLIGLVANGLGDFGIGELCERHEELGLAAVSEASDGGESGVEIGHPDFEHANGVGDGSPLASAGSDRLEFTALDQGGRPVGLEQGLPGEWVEQGGHLLAFNLLKLRAEDDSVLEQVGIALLVGGKEADQPSVAGLSESLQGVLAFGSDAGGELFELVVERVVVGRVGWCGETDEYGQCQCDRQRWPVENVAECRRHDEHHATIE